MERDHGANKQEIDWTEIVTTLKAGGHSFEEIKGYTIPQMMLFYIDALRRRLEYMVDVRTAVWADGKELDKHFREITK